MPVISTDVPAVMLDSRDLGESDKIITLFCQGIGRLSAIAKGAHRSKKRFVNKLEIFSFLHFTYSRSAPGRMAIITEAELINSFISIRSDVNRYVAASVLREFILAATSEGLGDDQIFRLVLWGLHSLNTGIKPQAAITMFLIKLFDCIGYKPDFSGCGTCGRPYHTRAPGFFDLQTGGLICSSCRETHTSLNHPLSADAIHLIGTAQQYQLEQLQWPKLSDIILAEALACMYQYGRYVFQRDFQSWRFFNAAIKNP